ncbi:MAG: hypothetical protein EBY42_00450 [Actinobacteria bacterium]|nr:hypothetical protein [Actinomycetota bacterium]
MIARVAVAISVFAGTIIPAASNPQDRGPGQPRPDIEQHMAWSFVEESIDQPVLTGAIDSGRFSCWRPPVNRPIIDPFRPPPCRWCSGNRGLEFAAQSGDDVHSVVSGTVWFHGSVGLTGYLTVIVEGSSTSLLVTVGGIEIDRRRLRGSNIAAGEFIGLARGPIHLGVRSGGTYIDPELWLRAGRGRARLVPLEAPGRTTKPRASCSPDVPGDISATRR